MGKIVILSEESAKCVRRGLLNESFHPVRAQVLKVKRYLDSMFVRDKQYDIDADGMPVKKATAVMMSDGQALKSMGVENGELLSLLDDRFRDMIKNDSDRRKFLNAVIKYWYTGDISKEGMLPVNTL